MLLTFTCEGPHAKDFGFLIHKNPASVFARDLAYGKLTLFYTENEPQRATVALICEVDTVSLVRGGNRAAALDQYVNDRPYVASSLTSVALRRAFASALAGKSKDRPELVTQPLPLRARVAAVHARGGAEIIEQLFRPLGYDVSCHPSPNADVLAFEISGMQTVHDLLSHLYVLLPVLDATKHYFIGDDEVEKLLAHGAGWLESHPERILITNRYLKFRRGLVNEALSQLTVGQPEEDAAEQGAEEVIEEQVRLHDQRIAAVVVALRDSDPPLRRIVDMGCGEGKLLQALLADRTFSEIVGVDVSTAMLNIAEKRLGLDRLPPTDRERVKLLQGSILYRDRRLEGYDAVTLIEVIEHIEEERLQTVRRVLFQLLRPRRVVITTPNAEYNARFASARLPSGAVRHADHRFEWSRAQFQSWCEGALPHGYAVRLSGIGPHDAEVGAPTQMAVFDREAG